MVQISNAVDIGGIRATITADASGYNQAVDKAKAKAKELGEAGKQASASFATLNTRLSELGASASQIEKINDRLKKANPQILERQLAAVRDELTKLGASSKEIEKITSELQKNARSANVVGKEVRQLGLAYTALAAAMAVVIKKAVETSAAFEQSMAQVKAITSATGEEFDKLRNQAVQLGATTVFTSSQAADAMGYLGMAGFKTRQIMESLPSVLALAAAGQMDLARTADIASNILTGFQLEASEAARVSDVLAKTMTNSNTNIEQLGYAFKYVAPIAASVGVSIEEAAAAIGKLSDAGIQGEMAGTQLRAILLRLVKPVGESAEVMEQLGVNIKDAAGNILPFNEIIGQLEKGFAKLTQAQQAEAASIIAGTEAASGFLTLIKTGSATLDSFTKDLQNAGGTAQDIADTQMDTLNGAIKEMESALEAVGITIGDKFAPAIRGVAEALTGVLLGFNNLNPALQTAIIAFATVVPLVAGAVTAIYALRAALVALEISVPILGAVSVAIGLVVAGIAALVSSNNEAAESAKRFEQAQKSLHDQLNKSPLLRTAEEVRQLQESEKELTELLRERKQIERDLAEAREKPRDIFDRDARKNLADLNEKLAETDKRLRDMGYEGVEAAEKGVRDLRQAVEESIPGLLELKQTELAELATKNEKIVSMEKLSERYKELSAQQTLDESQKQELVDVTNALKREYPALIAHMDEENRVRIENINKIDERIAADKSLLESAVNTSIGSIDAWKKQEEAQKLSIERQIENAKKYVDAMNQVGNFLSDKFGINVGETRFGKLVGNLVDKGRAELEEQRNKAQATMNELDRVKASLESGSYDDFKLPTGTGDGTDLSKSKKENTSKTKKSGKSTAEIAADLRKKAYDADIATVRYQADMYDWSAEKQIAAYEKVRNKHAQHLKETVEDERTMNLQLKRLHEDTVKSRFDFSAEWITQQERRMEESYKSEVDIAKMKLDAWARVRDRYKKDTDEYKRADEQMYQARKQLAQAQFAESNEWITMESRRMEEAGKTEAEIEKMKLAAWTRVRDRYAKDSEFYKRADEQVYQSRKRLASLQEKLANDLLKTQKTSIEDAKKAELKAIEERKKAALSEYDARIKAIDDLIAKEAEFNADADYETKLAEKRARLALLESAVGPDGLKERDDILKEIERMELEHARELRKRELENEKQAYQDEKSQREQAFDREKADVEAKYDALKAAFEDFGGDVRTIESAISDFRVQSNEETNALILSNLDDFVREYNAKLSEIQAVSAQDADLAEYNVNKDAWKAAKARGDAAEMARLNARNDELRRKYGIAKDTGKLPSFDVGGVVPGPTGHPLLAMVHGGEAVFNQRQLSRLFTLLDAPVSTLKYERPAVAPQSIVNHIDMSVNDAIFEDDADIQTLYSERERTARRLQTRGVKTV